jgi:hypothetical protein
MLPLRDTSLVCPHFLLFFLLIAFQYGSGNVFKLFLTTTPLDRADWRNLSQFTTESLESHFVHVSQSRPRHGVLPGLIFRSATSGQFVPNEWFGNSLSIAYSLLPSSLWPSIGWIRITVPSLLTRFADESRHARPQVPFVRCRSS